MTGEPGAVTHQVARLVRVDLDLEQADLVRAGLLDPTVTGRAPILGLAAQYTFPPERSLPRRPPRVTRHAPAPAPAGLW